MGSVKPVIQQLIEAALSAANAGLADSRNREAHLREDLAVELERQTDLQAQADELTGNATKLGIALDG